MSSSNPPSSNPSSSSPSSSSPGMLFDDGRLRSAHALGELIAKGEVSAVDVVEQTLGQIERHNQQLNAVVSLSPSALDEAAVLDRRRVAGEPPGILHGLPVVVKDVTETAGLRTTYGSPIYADHVPAVDALVVERLRAAGAIVIGKGNTPEMALGGHTDNPIFGHTRNPWNPELSPGGSTGGGAVALATGMAALAEGTDLGGSLRIPAAFCGLVGIRPTPGLVPTWPTPHPWDTLQVNGPMARSVQDLALFLDATAGFDPRSPLSRAAAVPSYSQALVEVGTEGLRIAYVADPTGMGIDSDLESCCREAAFSLSNSGVQVEEIDLSIDWARATFRELRGLWALAWHQHRLGVEAEAGQNCDPRLGANVKANLETGLSFSARQLGAASQERGRLLAIFLDLFNRFDAILTPTMAVKPFAVADGHPTEVGGRRMETYIDWLAPTSVLSLTSLPVLSVPAGLDGDGMPVGLQVVGRPFDELGAMKIGREVCRLRPIPGPPGFT